MLDRSGIESEVVTHNIIPDDPYQPDEEEDTRYYPPFPSLKFDMLILKPQ
jgi:hypothetical protein